MQTDHTGIWQCHVGCSDKQHINDNWTDLMSDGIKTKSAYGLRVLIKYIIGFDGVGL